MDMTAEEYLEQNTEYTGNEYDVFHIIDIAKFMNNYASIKCKELEGHVKLYKPLADEYMNGKYFKKIKELEKHLQKEAMKQLSLLDQIKELEEKKQDAVIDFVRWLSKSYVHVDGELWQERYASNVKQGNQTLSNIYKRYLFIQNLINTK